MTFEEDLIKRRIDVAAFAAGDPEKFAAWQQLYQQVHPNSFYTKVKMVINDVRRRFWLAEVPKPTPVPATDAPKPVVRRATIPSTASAIPDEPSPSVDRTPEPAPARPRAVIRRPAGAPTDNILPPAVPETENIPLPPVAAPAPETPKPGRARPVFRKPTEPAASNPAATSEAPANIPAENIPRSPAPAPTEAPTPPRPVFRKPAAPPDNPIPPATAEPEVPGTTTAGTETLTGPPPAEAKPARPRPVFKRPAPAAPAAVDITGGELPGEPALEVPKETITPVRAEELPPENKKMGTEPLPETTEEKQVPKPPRPRPVFKRPSQPGE